jgi:hypothetical protein
MRVVKNQMLNHVLWHVEHNGKVLNTFRTRALARKAIKDCGELAKRLSTIAVASLPTFSG